MDEEEHGGHGKPDRLRAADPICLGGELAEDEQEEDHADRGGGYPAFAAAGQADGDLRGVGRADDDGEVDEQDQRAQDLLSVLHKLQEAPSNPAPLLCEMSCAGDLHSHQGRLRQRAEPEQEPAEHDGRELAGEPADLSQRHR